MFVPQHLCFSYSLLPQGLCIGCFLSNVLPSIHLVNSPYLSDLISMVTFSAKCSLNLLPRPSLTIIKFSIISHLFSEHFLHHYIYIFNFIINVFLPLDLKCHRSGTVPFMFTVVVLPSNVVPRI